jgi:hypothetical protein
MKAHFFMLVEIINCHYKKFLGITINHFFYWWVKQTAIEETGKGSQNSIDAQCGACSPRSNKIWRSVATARVSERAAPEILGQQYAVS